MEALYSRFAIFWGRMTQQNLCNRQEGRSDLHIIVVGATECAYRKLQPESRMKTAIICNSILLLLKLQESSSLSVSKSKNSPPIKKVAIIGSGICGLSLAHALQNSDRASQCDIEAHVFDARQSLNFDAGAGIQLTGGLATLRKINPDVHRAVANAGLPLKQIKSRCKPWFRSESPFATLLELNLEESIKIAGGSAEEELIIDGEVQACAIMRGALQETLLNTLPKECVNRVQFNKQLTNIESGSDGIKCQFNDGTEAGPFDIVIGSDGINSAVKEYIDMGSISDGGKKESTIYSGIRVQYAIQDGKIDDSDVDSSELCQYFGDAAYSLAGIYGAGEGKKPTKGAFLIFKDPDWNGPFKKKEATGAKKTGENADWTQDVESVGSIMYQRIKDGEVPDIQVGPIVQNADRFFELGVYFHNPLSLRGWSKEVQGSANRYVVLAGDAAHAMVGSEVCFICMTFLD